MMCGLANSLNRTQERLLEVLAHYGYLSAFQVTKLLYGNSLTFVQRNLSELLGSRYLQAIPYSPPVARTFRGGRARRIYTLDQRGHDYLRASGAVPAARFRPSERAKRRPISLEHTLATNDLLILTHLLCRRNPEFQLDRFETDAQLKRHAVYIAQATPQVAVIPDAWTLLVSGEDEYGIAWELDRATENRTAFREKVRMLAYYSQGPYSREFETDSLMIAFVAAEGGQRRLQSMVSWTEAELAGLSAHALRSTFFFASFNPEQADPDQVFRSPIWRQPFSEQPVSLLDG